MQGAWWFELVNLWNTFLQDGYCSRVRLLGSEPNWHGPATFATAGTSGRADAFAQALPMWLSNAMVLQFFASPMSFPGMGGKAISASLSSCGTRPVAAVSVHAAAMTCVHADNGACARCPTTTFHCYLDLQDLHSECTDQPFHLTAVQLPTAHLQLLYLTCVSGGIHVLAWGS